MNSCKTYANGQKYILNCNILDLNINLCKGNRSLLFLRKPNLPIQRIIFQPRFSSGFGEWNFSADDFGR